VFHTSLSSATCRDLAQNPRAALVFLWPALDVAGPALDLQSDVMGPMDVNAIRVERRPRAVVMAAASN
jgi:pyridoxine/pyridoxamine 5'-phosphate oxidase